MKIHMHAIFPHYLRHLEPVFWALPPELRGDQLDPVRPHYYRLPPEDVIMVASGHELDGQAPQRFIYVEHGAGQTYDVADDLAYYYSGAKHPENVVGYICPSLAVANRWDRPAVAVGCPALDKHQGAIRPKARAAAITFHWDAHRVCDEARSARPHYEDDLPMIVQWLRQHDYRVIGHAHPRDRDAESIWNNLGVEFQPDPDVVLRTCQVLVADNTSLLYEACKLDIVTHVLNAPWYRREVHHGLRFWDTIPGRMVDDAYELVSVRPDHYDNGDQYARRLAAERAYAWLPPQDKAANRAAQWIVDLVA